MRLYALVLSICSFVYLSVAKMRTQKLDLMSKTKHFRPMASIDDLWEVLHRLFKEPITGPLKFNMAEIRYFTKIVKSPYLNEKSSDLRFWWNLIHNSIFGTRWQSRGQIWFFLNSIWWTAAILKIVFDHNSTCDCPISVKFCLGKRFSQNCSNGQIFTFHRTYFFVFLMQFGLRWSAPFISSPIHLLVFSSFQFSAVHITTCFKLKSCHADEHTSLT